MSPFSKNKTPGPGVFDLHLPFKPAGSQPAAIEKLTAGLGSKQTLLGVTGSGKTFTLANVIARQSKPVIIFSPNKTLAAQLYEEFSLFIPNSKVCYFVSYYDYYQPESYLPAQDIYIPKETKINSEIERLRVEATASIIGRPDTIIIASVSAIYSLGNPWDWRNVTTTLRVGDKMTRRELINHLISIQYRRNDNQLQTGMFQVIGNVVTVALPYQRDWLRIELFGDEIESLELIEKNNYKVVGNRDEILLFPAKHFVTTNKRLSAAIEQTEDDLEHDAAKMTNPLYRERLKTRVSHDIEMLKETGYCNGIENYSRYFDGRKPGDAPYCLFDYFDDEFLLIIDESHIAIPQLGGMYKGDRSRKGSLIEYGFRLTSAFDNRPLKFEEIERYFKNAIFVSATPSDYEMEHSDAIVEQIVRPTGIVDPTVEVVKREGQLEHLLGKITSTTEKGFRSLVTVLTKRMAEELANYLEEKGVKVCYLHSDIKTPQRSEILHKLRQGVFECLVGINLLREGLDLPEVAFVGILDADIEGFLRNGRSLIQTIGRAARNTESTVVFYADKMTKSMRSAIDETDRRRRMQIEHNKKHGIVPRTATREVTKSISQLQQAIKAASKVGKRKPRLTEDEKATLTESLEADMRIAAESLDFERAIALRDQLKKLL